MRFEWDKRKAAANRRKHRVSFEEAGTVFSDALAITGADPDHSVGESRWLTFGVSDRGRLPHQCQAGHPGRTESL